MKKLTLEDYDYRIQQTVWNTVRKSIHNAVCHSNTTKIWLGVSESVLDPVRNTVYWSVWTNIEETIQ